MANGPKTGRKVYKHLGMRYWAQEGAVHWVDERAGDQGDVSCTDWLARAEAIGDLSQGFTIPQERLAHEKAANEMVECAREAADMGDPFDPRVIAFRRRHQLWKNPQILVPGIGVATVIGRGQ